MFLSALNKEVTQYGVILLAGALKWIVWIDVTCLLTAVFYPLTKLPTEPNS